MLCPFIHRAFISNNFLLHMLVRLFNILCTNINCIKCIKVLGLACNLSEIKLILSKIKSEIKCNNKYSGLL